MWAGLRDFLIVTSEGFGKRVDPEQFSRKKRAGLGVRGIGVNEKKGHVVGAMFVAPDDEMLLISSGGVIIRTTAGDVSMQGRDATGVTVMSLSDGEQVSAVARLLTAEPDDDADVDADLEDHAGPGGDVGSETNGASQGSGADGAEGIGSTNGADTPVDPDTGE